MNKTKNIPLIVGLSIPLAMIVFVTASIYLPQLWAPQPKTNFLYSLSSTYYPAKEYFVSNNKIAERILPYTGNPNRPQPLGDIRIYLHDVVRNEGREISFEEAQTLLLDNRALSPDGFEVVPGTRGESFFLFFYNSEDYSSLYLKGHHTTKKLHLYKIGSIGSGNYSYYNNRYRFIGWVRE